MPRPPRYFLRTPRAALHQLTQPGSLRLLLISLLAWSGPWISAAHAAAPAYNQQQLQQQLIDILGDPQRQQDARRDRYRHPAETLAFFEVGSTMSVAEIWPGGSGWYSEILAPLLRDHGHYYAAQFPRGSGIGFYDRARADFTSKIEQTPHRYGHPEITTFDLEGNSELAPANSLDRVLTFRNIHNWYMKEGDRSVQAAMQQFYTALKPGGLLGVVEHRLASGRPLSEQQTSGYMNQDYVIRMAQQAGFELVASSEINANPLDSSVHPAGVWTLPPTLRLGDDNRAYYESIGESDRMTLKFKKPATQEQQAQ